VGSTGRIAVVLTVTLFTVTLGGIRAMHRAVPAPRVHAAPIAAAPSSPDPEPATDLIGNEITQAVATYKLDATGSLYEEHSPQTEVPRLGSPKS
jgi:hypothetical protein